MFTSVFGVVRSPVHDVGCVLIRTKEKDLLLGVVINDAHVRLNDQQIEQTRRIFLETGAGSALRLSVQKYGTLGTELRDILVLQVLSPSKIVVFGELAFLSRRKKRRASRLKLTMFFKKAVLLADLMTRIPPRAISLKRT